MCIYVKYINNELNYELDYENILYIMCTFVDGQLYWSNHIT